MSQRKSEYTHIAVQPGMFIPQRVELEKKQKQKRSLQQVGAAAVLLLMVGVASGYTMVLARVSPNTQAAAAPTFILQNDNYAPNAVKEGRIDTLAQEDTFNTVLTQTITSVNSVLALDLVNNNLSLYKNGTLVLASPINKKPDISSWRFSPPGFYKMSGRSERKYSAVGMVYYPYAIEFGKNFLLHGVPEAANGDSVGTNDTGIEISTNNAKDIYTLLTDDTVFLVRNTTEAATKNSYTHQGDALEQGSYLVFDVESGDTLVVDGDVSNSRPIASLTKLMTALVVAENYDIDAEVFVSQEKYVDTLIPRLEGLSKITNYHLLQLLLVESSNEAAEVLASEIGRDEFIKEMNKAAKKIGMNDTVFTDPSGLDNGNISSLEDLATLSRYIYNRHRFIWVISVGEPIVYSKSYEASSTLANFNLVTGLADLVGGKIGETQAAGQTSLTLHKMQFGEDKRVVGIVILDSAHRSADVNILHNYAITHFY